MRVVVCTKETPDTAAKVEVGPDGAASWGDAPLVINPWDEYAVEEALLMKDKGASTVTVLGMGTEATKEALKHALAMGADEAVLISDEALKGADTLVTSHALAQAIKKLDDTRLVILGKMTTDGATGQTGAQVGRRLGWNTLTFVSKVLAVDFDAGTIKVERMVEGGKQVVEASLPAVLTVVKEINEPRYPSFMGIRKASRAEIPVWGAADIGLDAGVTAKVKWPELSAPPARVGECEIIDGASPQEKAASLLNRLIEEKVI
ncbi:MAG: electron transfer flavoprotein subunit beta/FixA family protein [Anaerolineae bacterium]